MSIAFCIAPWRSTIPFATRDGQITPVKQLPLLMQRSGLFTPRNHVSSHLDTSTRAMLPFAASNRLELSVFKRGWLPLPVHHAAPPPPAAAAELGWKSPRSNSHGSGTSPPSVPKSSSQLSRSSSQISSCESSLLPESDLGPSLAESEKLSSESLQKPRHAHHSSATTTTARISLASRAAGVLVTTDVRRVDGGIQIPMWNEGFGRAFFEMQAQKVFLAWTATPSVPGCRGSPPGPQPPGFLPVPRKAVLWHVSMFL